MAQWFSDLLSRLMIWPVLGECIFVGSTRVPLIPGKNVRFDQLGIILPIEDPTRGGSDVPARSRSRVRRSTLVRYSETHTIMVRTDAEPRFMSITLQPGTEIAQGFERLTYGGFTPGTPRVLCAGYYKSRILVPVDYRSDLMRQAIQVIQDGQLFEHEFDCGPLEVDSAVTAPGGANVVAMCLERTDWA